MSGIDETPHPSITVSTGTSIFVGGGASYVLPQPPEDVERLRLAADRMHRMAFVADQTGAVGLAGPLRNAAYLMRLCADNRGSLDGTRVSHLLADAILGEDDQRPLP